MSRHFEQLADLVTKDMIRKEITCGPDVSKHVEAINKYADVGFDHVYVTQCGPDQESFIRFYQEQVMPKLDLAREPATAASR